MTTEEWDEIPEHKPEEEIRRLKMRDMVKNRILEEYKKTPLPPFLK